MKLIRESTTSDRSLRSALHATKNLALIVGLGILAIKILTH